MKKTKDIRTRFTFSVTPEVREWLRKMAYEHDMYVSEFVMMCVHKYKEDKDGRDIQ